MKIVKLGDSSVAEVSAGQAAPQDTKYFSSSGCPFIRAGSLESLCSGGTIRELEYIEPDVAKKFRLRLFPKDTVVFAKSGMSAKLGRVYRLIEPSYVVSHLAAVIPKNDLDAGYLTHFLVKYPPSRLIPNDAYPSIRLSEIENITIKLPLIAEQRRIAAILDKADAIRRKRQEALKLADDFLNGVFLDMFGDPVTNPKGWTVEPLYNVIDEVQGGWSVGGENRVKKADEKGVLKISAVTSGKYLPQEHKAVARDDCKRVLLTPKMGDLLFTRANTRELVAATCIVDFEDEDLFLPDKIWNIIPYTHKATKIFLKALFSHPKMRSRITRQSTGTSGSMLNISKTKLLNTEFPIPDFSMQEKFSNIYISSMNAMKKYSLLYNEAVNMANSLSSSFFKEH